MVGTYYFTWMVNEYWYHIKKRNKMPPFFCNYNDLEMTFSESGTLLPGTIS